ncbi:MAG TPA: T9SS type A sorting domain-containing protein [Chitinophagales bacterium]|nr:T9SS type A sorting domain-containing protein [Chitinophagales bacterium]
MKHTILLLICLSFTLYGSGQNGSLDSTFGTNGIISNDLAIPYQGAVGYALMPDGRMVTCINIKNQCFVECFLPDGTIDSSFGTNGAFQIGDANVYGGTSIAVDAASRILVTETIYDYYYYVDVTVTARLTPNGIVDSSFGTDGFFTSQIIATKIVLQADGKIILAGYNYMSGYGELQRLNSDGTPDNSYGSNSLVYLNMFFGIKAAVLQDDGKLVCAAEYLFLGFHFVVARLNTNGSLDNTFSGDGYVSHSDYATLQHIPFDIAIQPDQKIVVAGQVFGSGQFTEHGQIMTWRFLPDGTTDFTFDNDGTFQIPNSLGYGYDVASFVKAFADTTLLIGGIKTNNLHQNPFILKLKQDGSYDSSFAVNGISTINEDADVRDGDGVTVVNAILISDTDIMVGATVYENGNFQPGLFKLSASGEIDATFGNNGESTYRLPGFQEKESTAGIIQLASGKILAGVLVNTDAWPALEFIRYLPNGAVDSSYFNHGLFEGDALFSAEFSINTDFFVATDSQIYAAIWMNYYFDSSRVCLLRMNAEGIPDSSFGYDGFRMVKVPGHILYSFQEMAIQADGKILMYVQEFAMGGSHVIRLNADGSFDPTFAGTGFFTMPAYLHACPVTDITIRPSGEILISAIHDTAITGIPPDLVLAQLTTDGIYDASFGNNGLVILPVTAQLYNDRLNTLLRPNGKIVLCEAYNFGGYSVHLWQFEVNGVLDPSFGINGEAQIDSSQISMSQLNKFILQPDGKILACGTGWNPSNSSTVVRLNTNGVVDSTFATDGLFILDDGNQSYGTCITLQSDGKILVSGQDVTSDLAFNQLIFRLDNLIGPTSILPARHEAQIALYPNPASENVNVVFNEFEKGNLSMTIADAEGAVVYEKEIIITSSQQHFNLKTESLPAGIYFVTLMSEGEKTLQKLVITK